MPRKRRRDASRIEIQDGDLNDGNLAELAAHGITARTLDQLLDGPFRCRPNKRGRAATHQLLGPDHGGQIWVVCIYEVEPLLWRPVTGWDAKQHEIAWWRRQQ